MAKEWLAVAIGGALGVTLRHAIAIGFASLGASWLPIATLVANLVGCFSIGALSQWSLQADSHGHWWVVGVRVGLLGGLTTFSSFALDIVKIWQSEKLVWSSSLVAMHVLVGVLALLLGAQLVKTPA